MSPDSGSSKTVLDADRMLHRVVIDSLVDYAVFAVSPGGLVMSWNVGAQRAFGYAPSEVIGTSIGIIFTIEDARARVLQAELASALSGEKTNHERWHVRKDGSRFLTAKSVATLLDASGAHIGFSILAREIAPVAIAAERSGENELRARSVLDSVHDYAIFSLTVDGTVTSWNAGAQELFGYSATEMVGENVALLYGGDRGLGVPATELLAAASGSATNERKLVRKDGTSFLASGKVSALRGGSGHGFVNVLHDITDRAAADQDLRHRAHFDELTQLPNRRTFYEHVQRAIASMKRRSSDLFAVLFVDIDHFKCVNDEFGHIVADRLLAATARRLEDCFRTEDIVARIGGDEFGILIASIRGVADARDAADRIEVEMRKPLVVEAARIFSTVSIGIAIGNLGYESPEDILRDADAAMYVAKTSGRGRAALFASSDAGA